MTYIIIKISNIFNMFSYYIIITTNYISIPNLMKWCETHLTTDSVYGNILNILNGDIAKW
jgi:hypothetical protein